MENHNSPASSFRVFVFSKTTGYRHASIPAGIQSLINLGTDPKNPYPFTVEASEDASLINYEHLAQFQVVVFLSTSGEFLTSEQVGALRRYMTSSTNDSQNGAEGPEKGSGKEAVKEAEKEAGTGKGGGFVGIHSATAGMYTEPWYGEELLGAYFTDHPHPQHGLVKIDAENADHPIIQASVYRDVAEFKWFDEWYNYNSDPRQNNNNNNNDTSSSFCSNCNYSNNNIISVSGSSSGSGVKVLLSIDEEGYEGGSRDNGVERSSIGLVSRVGR